MKQLISDINRVKKSQMRITIERRLHEFEALGKKGKEEWFSELCFCILTANSKAKTGIAIQKEIGVAGFMRLKEKEISKIIRNNKHRFHNNKAAYIVEARRFFDIKDKVKGFKDEREARDWIAENVKGLGYKEASHFLRNVGYKNVAIIDRHILSLMCSHGICSRPKNLGKKNYAFIEGKFSEIATKMGMNLAELDLYMWYMKTGEVLK